LKAKSKNKCPFNTENEQEVARRNPLFLLLCRVIVRTSCHIKSWKQSNTRKDCT